MIKKNINLSSELNIEDLLDINKRFVIIRSCIECSINNNGDKSYRLFKFGECPDTFYYVLFGYDLFGIDEFEEFINYSENSFFNRVFGEDHEIGIYEIDFLLKKISESREEIEYYSYENHDSIIFLGKREEYEKKLVGWESLSNSKDIFLNF